MLVVSYSSPHQYFLRASALAERDAEIESLRRSQKGGKVMELSNEKEEYYIETLRLKQVVTEVSYLGPYLAPI